MQVSIRDESDASRNPRAVVLGRTEMTTRGEGEGGRREGIRVESSHNFWTLPRIRHATMNSNLNRIARSALTK